MLNHLRDVVKHTASLGVEIVKLVGDAEGNVIIEGMDNEKSVIIKGKFLNKLKDFEGTCGLGNLDWLSGFVNLYKEKDDTVKIIRKEQTVSVKVEDENGDYVVDKHGNYVYEEIKEEVLEEIQFMRKSPKMKNSYRVVNRGMIPDQYVFRGAEWDVIIKPTKQSIDLLAQQASIGFETLFGVKTENNVLYLTFGDNNQGEIEFAQDVEGQLTKSWLWDISKVLGVLKLSDKAECTMSFLDKGALQITLNTGLGEYNYIMPARAR